MDRGKVYSLSPQMLQNSISRDRTDIPIVFTPVDSEGRLKLRIIFIRILLQRTLQTSSELDITSSSKSPAAQLVVVQSLSCVQLFCDPMDCNPPGFSVHGIFLARITGVGGHFLLQGIFLIQGSNLRLLHWKVDYLPLSHQGSLQTGLEKA